MADVPAVSIVMNCRDGEKYLREALDSLAAQTLADWEVVFWDNASADASPELARSFGSRLRYFRSEQPLLLGAARNCALRRCRAPFIAFLDVDDVWAPEYLAAQLEAVQAAAEIGLSYTDAFLVEGDRRRPICRMSEQYRLASGDVFFAFVRGMPINPSMAMVRRAALDDVGLFDESYDFVEESELFLRIARKYRFAYVPRPLVEYRYHAANYSNRFLEQQAEIERFRSELLERYPDIRSRRPTLEREWRFNSAARQFHWRLSRKEYGLALRALVRLAGRGMWMPWYTVTRMVVYLGRRLGLRPSADWVR
jgi:glycosyltransferase involved in cell wall biosynthesis